MKPTIPVEFELPLAGGVKITVSRYVEITPAQLAEGILNLIKSEVNTDDAGCDWFRTFDKSLNREVLCIVDPEWIASTERRHVDLFKAAEMIVPFERPK